MVNVNMQSSEDICYSMPLSKPQLDVYGDRTVYLKYLSEDKGVARDIPNSPVLDEAKKRAWKMKRRR